MEYRNFLGFKSGRLTVVAESPKKNGSRMWLCQCDCGNTTVVSSGNLSRKRGTKSCGCIWDNSVRKMKFYATWTGMIHRCENPKANGYEYYGGKGIIVCPEWRNDFMAFNKWAVENYVEGGTLDRRNGNGHYSPDNCRFSTLLEQANNRSNNVLYEINGEKKTIPEWARFYGVKINLVEKRVQKKWDIIAALTTPISLKHSHKKVHA